MAPTFCLCIQLEMLGDSVDAVAGSQPEGRMICGFLFFLLLVGVKDENGALGGTGRTSLDKPVSHQDSWEWPGCFLWLQEK